MLLNNLKNRSDKMQKTIHSKQQGMTFIGLVLVIAAVVFLAVLGMKITPAYLEFMSVKKAIKNVVNTADMTNKKEIINAFNNSASIDNVRVVSGKDLVLNGGEISVEYQVTIPIVANASVLLDFHATSAK
jgi:Tfp pilus assembly protein PilE